MISRKIYKTSKLIRDPYRIKYIMAKIGYGILFDINY